MSEPVIAQVILRTLAGLSVLEAAEPITTENAARYQVEEEVAEEATQKLSGYGFTIGERGPYGFSISADKALFEKVFATRLQARTADLAEPGVGAGKAVFYEATTPIRIPEPLSALVAGITLPQPPELFP